MVAVQHIDEDQVVIHGTDIERTTMSNTNNSSPRTVGYWYMGGTFSPSTYSYSPPVSNEMARETGLNCYVYNAPDTYSIERGQHRLPYTSSTINMDCLFPVKAIGLYRVVGIEQICLPENLVL